MKKKTSHHVGNLIFAYDRPQGDPDRSLFLITKKPKNKADATRKRKRVGIGRTMVPGGATEKSDRSQKHAAARELFEESGKTTWDMPLGHLTKLGILKCFLIPSGTQHTWRSWKRAKLVWIVHLYETIIPEHMRDDYKVAPDLVSAGWFLCRSMPYEKMMPSDQLWIPDILAGKKGDIRVLFEGEIGNAVRLEFEGGLEQTYIFLRGSK